MRSPQYLWVTAWGVCAGWLLACVVVFLARINSFNFPDSPPLYIDSQTPVGLEKLLGLTFCVLGSGSAFLATYYRHRLFHNSRTAALPVLVFVAFAWQFASMAIYGGPLAFSLALPPIDPREWAAFSAQVVPLTYWLAVPPTALAATLFFDRVPIPIDQLLVELRSINIQWGDLRRIALKASFLLPVLAAVMIVNLTIDPAGLFHDESISAREYARGMASGQITVARSTAQNWDWRALTRYFLDEVNLESYTVLMGSSTSFEVRQSQIRGSKFYNLAMTGANIEDYVILTSILAQRGRLPHTVILAVDPAPFLGELAPKFGMAPASAYTSWHGFGCDSVSITAGKIVTHCSASDSRARSAQRRSNQLSQLLSISYFQGSIRQLWYSVTTHSFGNPIFTVPRAEDVATGEVARLQDGSYLLDRFASHIVPTAVNDVGPVGTTYESLVSQDRVKLFESLIDYLHSHGTKVVFFVPPFKTVPNLNSFLEGFRKVYLRIAKSRSVPVVGSPFASEFGCGYDDFFSAVDHPKERCDDLAFTKFRALGSELPR